MNENPIKQLEGDGITIGSVLFSEGMLEIEFFDPRRQGDKIIEFTKLVIDRQAFWDDIDHIQEMLVDLIDDALRSRRN